MWNGGGGASNHANSKYSVVSGGTGNETDAPSSTISGGDTNRVIMDGIAGTISGGRQNEVSDSCGTVGGGARNHANGKYSVASGGEGNAISGSHSTVSGGNYNTADSNYVAIGGGRSNLAANYYASIGGGNDNTAIGRASTIAGGENNNADGSRSTIGGGTSNHTGGTWSTVPGGFHNSAIGDYSFAAGRYAQALHSGCFVWHDGTFDYDHPSSDSNQFVVYATGDILFYGSGIKSKFGAGPNTSISKGTYFNDNSIVAWGKVAGGSGSTSSNEFGVESVVRNGAGNYTVTLDATASSAANLIPIANAEVDVAPNSAATMRFVTINQVTTSTFDVYITNGLFTPTDNDFVFMVTAR